MYSRSAINASMLEITTTTRVGPESSSWADAGRTDHKAAAKANRAMQLALRLARNHSGLLQNDSVCLAERGRVVKRRDAEGSGHP